MRVLIVMPAMSPEAGAERSMAAVIPHLIEAGVEVEVVTLTEHRGLVPSLVSAGALAHDLSGDSFASRVRALRALLRERRFDVVHATLIQASAPAQVAALFTGTPVLVTWASTPRTPSGERVARWKLAVVRGAEMALAHLGCLRFHAVTEGVAEEQRRVLRVSRERVRVAERGRDARVFHMRDEAAHVAARSELGVSAGAKTLLAVGRQEPQKGYIDLLAAFARLAADDQHVELFIAGRAGSATPEILAAVDTSGLGHRVHLLGQCDDVVPLLHAADAVVCASVREGAAGALVEAMACGAPIVSVELAGMRGILQDGVNSMVVSRDRLTEGMRSILARPDHATRLAQAARQLFEERFTVERSSEALLGVYRWAAFEGTRRASR